jgi:hypothetical protein
LPPLGCVAAPNGCGFIQAEIAHSPFYDCFAVERGQAPSPQQASLPQVFTHHSECVSARKQSNEATCHASKDHTVHRQKWDYSFYVA